MLPAPSLRRRAIVALITPLAAAVATAPALAAPADDTFEYTPLGGALLTPSPTQLFIEDLSPPGEFGVAARRIAIGEAGVEEHVSKLIVDWPDPFGLTLTPDAAISTHLIADTNPDGVGDPIRASSVGLTRLPDAGGRTQYGVSFDFALLGSATATLRVYNGATLVAVDPLFGSGGSITLDGLPPGEPVVRTVKIPPGIFCDWRDDESDGDVFFDVDVIDVGLLPLNFAGFTLPGGAYFGTAADRIELTLNGPETELDGVFGFDYTGTGLSSFSISEVPAPGALAMLAVAALASPRRRQRSM